MAWRNYTVDNSQIFDVWAQYPKYTSKARRLRLPKAPIIARKRGTTKWWCYDIYDEIWKPMVWNKK